MAALIRHCTIGYSLLIRKNTFLTGTMGAVNYDVMRYKSNKPKRAKKKQKGPNLKSKWEWNEASLSSRGFLRPLKSYTPTDNVIQRLHKVCESIDISPDNSNIIDNFDERFKLFLACEKEFNHSIPNSMLYKIETIGDLKEFYETPVNTTLPLDAAIKMDLPKNLHIQTKYLRFNPDTDEKFGGKTAFPRSSTLVTGIKYKKMYPSLIQKSPWE